jgi:hypothetical protein
MARLLRQAAAGTALGEQLVLWVQVAAAESSTTLGELEEP